MRSFGSSLLGSMITFHAWRPPACRVSGITTRPLRSWGTNWTRGSPTSGAPTSSSSGTWWASAIGSSSSRLGLRCPDSSRDSVLFEIPVASDSSVSVTPALVADPAQSRADLGQDGSER